MRRAANAGSVGYHFWQMGVQFRLPRHENIDDGIIRHYAGSGNFCNICIFDDYAGFGHWQNAAADRLFVGMLAVTLGSLGAVTPLQWRSSSCHRDTKPPVARRHHAPLRKTVLRSTKEPAYDYCDGGAHRVCFANLHLAQSA